MNILSFSGGKKTEVIYECKVCQRQFESEASVDQFKEHFRTHLCGPGESSAVEIRLGTSANILWKCLTCSMVVNNVYNHRRTHHYANDSSKRPRKCDICGKVLGSDRSWRKHKTIHEAQKEGTSYTCVVCGKAYQRLILLKEHLKRHTDARTFMCGICGKTFLRNPDLARHMATHDRLKGVKCEHCDKGFSSQQLLRSHMKTHFAEKTVSCDKCQKEFTHKQGLDYHNKSGRCASL